MKLEWKGLLPLRFIITHLENFLFRMKRHMAHILRTHCESNLHMLREGGGDSSWHLQRFWQATLRNIKITPAAEAAGIRDTVRKGRDVQKAKRWDNHRAYSHTVSSKQQMEVRQRRTPSMEVHFLDVAAVIYHSVLTGCSLLEFKLQDSKKPRA